MLTKILIVSVLLLIIGSLAVALRHLLADGARSSRTVKALTWRIGLSIALFFMLLLGYQMGVLQPHGLKAQPPAGGAAK